MIMMFWLIFPICLTSEINETVVETVVSIRPLNAGYGGTFDSFCVCVFQTSMCFLSQTCVSMLIRPTMLQHVWEVSVLTNFTLPETTKPIPGDATSPGMGLVKGIRKLANLFNSLV